MQCRLVPLNRITEDDERAWADLARRACEPNPFMEPDFLVPYAQVAVGKGHRFRRYMEVALAEEDGQAHACLPVCLDRAVGGFPYRFVTTQVRGGIECGTPLMDPDRGPAALTAILSALSHRRRLINGRLLNVVRLSQDGPAFRALELAAQAAGFPFIVHESYDRGFLSRRATHDSDELCDPKFRKNLRRLQRRLHEELGGEPGLVNATSDPRAPERYLALEASGYKAGIGAAMLGNPGEAEWFCELCRRFAAAGRLYILELLAGGHTVAMRVWLRGGDGLFGFKTTYDQRYARYGPGLQLYVAARQYFQAETTAEWLDTCASRDNDLLLRLFPERRRTASVFIALSRNPLDRAVARSLAAVRPAHRWAYQRLHAGDGTKGGGRQSPGPAVNGKGPGRKQARPPAPRELVASRLAGFSDAER